MHEVEQWVNEKQMFGKLKHVVSCSPCQPTHALLCCAAILVVAGVMNIASTRIIAWLNAFSVVWHITGVVTLIILLPVVAPVTQSWSYVFTQFNDISFSTTGITNNGYLFLVGLLTAQVCSCSFCCCCTAISAFIFWIGFQRTFKTRMDSASWGLLTAFCLKFRD